MGEWLLSRRDRLIVARHEVPGWRCRKGPRPGGTVEVIVSPRDICRRDPFNRPAGTGLFSS